MIDYIRYVLIAGGFLIIGFNVSVIIHAKQLVTYVWPWRLFMTGQSMFALAAIVGLHKHLGRPVGLTASLVGVAIGLSVLSAFMLERAYRHSHPKETLKLAPARVKVRK